jgi:hypothetical protein
MLHQAPYTIWGWVSGDPSLLAMNVLESVAVFRWNCRLCSSAVFGTDGDTVFHKEIRNTLVHPQFWLQLWESQLSVSSRHGSASECTTREAQLGAWEFRA